MPYDFEYTTAKMYTTDEEILKKNKCLQDSFGLRL